MLEEGDIDDALAHIAACLLFSLYLRPFPLCIGQRLTQIFAFSKDVDVAIVTATWCHL